MTFQVEREELSTRERIIVEMVLDGRNNVQIAAALGIAPMTVKTHLRHAEIKLGRPDRTVPENQLPAGGGRSPWWIHRALSLGYARGHAKGFVAGYKAGLAEAANQSGMCADRELTLP